MSKPNNAAVIADLSRRIRRAKSWRLFFLLLMPLGFIVPCGLAFAVIPAQEKPPPQGITLPQILGMIAFGLPIIGLAGWLLMFMDKSNYTRALALAKQADEMGFNYSRKTTPSLLEMLGAFQTFIHYDNHSGSNCCAGEKSGRRIAVLDYRVSLRLPTLPGPKLYAQTVVVISDLQRQTPDFRLTPKKWIHVVSELLGDKSIEVPDQEKFNKRFVLSGDDPDRIVSLISPKVVDLLNKAQATVEVSRSNMVFYRHNELAAPEDVDAMVEGAVRISDALH
jgi:hypothetical protein